MDANAFIRCTDFNELAKKYDIYTSHAVIAELKDEKTRDKF